MTSQCIIGISGYSGSGKTTLIEKALAELRKEGLSVGILKHSCGLTIDSKDKDTARFYKAGADFVFAHDPHQGFARHRHEELDLIDALRHFPRGLDLIIVEGYKNSPVSRIWIKTRKAEHTKKSGSSMVLYGKAPDSLNTLIEYIHRKLEDFHSKRPVKAGLLVGGMSRRMGRSKAQLKIKNETLVERSYKTLKKVSIQTVLLGSARLPDSLKKVPSLLDVPELDGPMAGMLSAFRWDPDSSWIISAVDMPFMNKDAWDWLLGQRRPGVWAVLPRIKGLRGVETTGGCYEPMIFEYIESNAKKGICKLQLLSRHPKVIKPIIPESLVSAWRNFNTAAEWKEALAQMKR
jgi:molybdopterin-guanine dinucleotide biosynthesis protein MobB